MSAVSPAVRLLLREVGDATVIRRQVGGPSLPTLILDAIAADDPAVCRKHLLELASAALLWAADLDEHAAAKAAA